MLFWSNWRRDKSLVVIVVFFSDETHGFLLLFRLRGEEEKKEGLK
jgi:hypothetical protein